ncbi:hypothetical protein ACWWIZ_003767 [Cronobacter sakazakii]|uniref:hypothetical protein n=1 Tax=Cronobacter dublinensis TaxID=413497 RepID=UPI000CFBEB37|nr:hypothetical protein [Cronobacter dublinensis]ELY5987730.1 hypothetical protein [Cronobacter sakazakii]
MDKKKLIQITTLFSDFRDAASDAVSSHINLIEKLSSDALNIAEKPDEEWSAKDRIIFDYYNDNLISLVADSIKSIDSYTEGTQKYISALEQVIEAIEKD